MSDQVKQQVIVEFLGTVLPAFEKSIKDVINGLKQFAGAQKEASSAMNEGSKSQDKHAQTARNLGTETDKVVEKKKKYSKVLKELKKDYKESGAGLQSVYEAFKYHTAGVTKGNIAIDAAKRKTTEYISALTGTNSVLMSYNKSWGEWAKTVSYKTILDAEANKQIKITKNGIQLLTAEAGKAIGMSDEQVKALRRSSIAQDIYSQKLREATGIGGDYLASFQKLSKTLGTTDNKVAIWSKSLEDGNKTLAGFAMQLNRTGAGSTSLVSGLSKSAIAMNLMNGNLKISNGNFKIYNETGLRALGISEEQASKMKMLASSYGAYGSTLQKMTQSHDANLKTFKAMTDQHGRGELVVKQVNKALAETEKVISAKTIVAHRLLSKAVADGTLTQVQADRQLKRYTESLDRTAIANKIFAENQNIIAYGARRFSSDMAKAAKENEKYQDAFNRGLKERASTPNQFKDYLSALNTVESAIKKTGKAMNLAGKDGDSFVNAANRWRLTTQYMGGNLRIVNGQLANTSQTLIPLKSNINSLTALFDKLSTSLINVAKYSIGAFAFYGTVNLVGGVINQIIQYDQALKDLQAITTATDYETKMFGETIMRVASDTKFSATEVAEGMKNLGQAGFSAAETIEVIDDAATLATGTLSNFETVTDLLTTTMRAYHLEAAEAGRLTDLFANAINRSKLDVDKLRVAFNYFANVADKANITVDDSVTLMGMLANSGVRASTIGTSLRQVVEGLVSPSKEFREAIEQAGYTIDQFVVSDANPLVDVIRRLQHVVPDAAAAFDLFGIRGAPAVSAITSLGVKGFLEMREAMQEAGSAAAMAELQMEGLGNQAKNMKDKFELVAIVLGEAGLKSVLRELIGLARSLADVLISAFSNPMGAFILAITTLALGLGAVSGAIKLLLATKWATTMAAWAIGTGAFSAQVTLLNVALGVLRTGFITLFATPMGWAALGLGAIAVASAVSKASNQMKNFAEVAQKNKTAIDEEIKVSNKKKSVVGALISIAKDQTKTDAQRTDAINKLLTLGVQVNGVLRDQTGIITNLDEVTKNNTDSFKAYNDELERFMEMKHAQKILEDVDAYNKASEGFAKALTTSQNFRPDYSQMTEADFANVEGWEKEAKESAQKAVSAAADILSGTEQKVEEVIKWFMTLDAKTYETMLKRAGMADEEAANIAKNFNSMDANFLMMWLKQTKAADAFGDNAAAILLKLQGIMQQTATTITSSVEYQYKKIVEQLGVETKEIMKSMPDLDDPNQLKDEKFYLDSLAKFGEKKAELMSKHVQKLFEAQNMSGSPEEVAARVKDLTEATDNALKSADKTTQEDTRKAVDALNEIGEIRTQMYTIGLDNQITALEAKSAQEIGIEQDTANKILDLRSAQLASQIAQKQQYLAMLLAHDKNDVQAQMGVQQEIANLQAQQAQLRVERIANIEDKKKDERERAEKVRAFDHSMELAKIDLVYWDDKNLRESAASDQTIAYLDKEIAVHEAYKAERKRLGQNTFDEEQILRDLRLQRTEEMYAKEIRLLENKKSLERDIEAAKADNLQIKADETEDPDDQMAALTARQAIERKSWEEQHKNLLDDKTLYYQLMHELDVKHQRQREALIRRQQVLEYQKAASFFGELSGLMGEFYEISNQKAVAFFYAQKALAIAEIIMNAHAGAMQEVGKAGVWGIPTGAMILAMGYAKAGIVAGLTIAQGTKGFADGGEITGYSPNSKADNIPIRATAGEFMQPVASVDYYGKGAMEAIRARLIPREALAGYGKYGHKSGGRHLADGGAVSAEAPDSTQKGQEPFHIVNILDPNMFDQYMSSYAGQKTLANFISRNPAIIKNALR